MQIKHNSEIGTISIKLKDKIVSYEIMDWSRFQKDGIKLIVEMIS